MTIEVGTLPPGAFITHLSNKCGFKKHGPPVKTPDFEIYHLDLSSLNLDIGILVPFVIYKHFAGYLTISSEQIEEAMPAFEEITKSLHRKVVVLAIGGRLARIQTPTLEDLQVCGIAIIDRPIIDRVIKSSENHAPRILSAALVQFLGRDGLSPYVSGRPAIGGRFFGRSSVMKRILPSKVNVTIIGNRRIGKTSVLKEIRERLKLQNVRTAEVYGPTCRDTTQVVYKILHDLGLVYEARLVLSDPVSAMNLPSYLHRIPDEQKRSVAVFIDELDHILEFDAKQGFELMHLLRNAFDGHDSCRIFLAGFRRVMQVKQSMDTPPFNFTKLFELPLFTREETFEMVTKGLTHLGVEIADTDLPGAIFKDTGGHPELIQIHCAEIVRFVETHNRIPTGENLLTDVFNTEEYKQKVLGTFLANTNAYEELLCYLLMSDAELTQRADQYEFGPADINRVLSTVDVSLGIRDLNAVVTNLKVSGIIAQVSGRVDTYRFSSPQLVNYCVNLDLQFCITKALERLRDLANSAYTLYSEPDDVQGKKFVFKP